MSARDGTYKDILAELLAGETIKVMFENNIYFQTFKQNLRSFKSKETKKFQKDCPGLPLAGTGYDLSLEFFNVNLNLDESISASIRLVQEPATKNKASFSYQVITRDSANEQS